MEHHISLILSFLEKIGIHYTFDPITNETFLPGLKLHMGTLIIDMEKLLYPGDILHEAGHLACMPPAIRDDMSDNLLSGDLHDGGEMMAIAWSYAASVHLGLNPHIVFHQQGYKGGSQNLIDNFSQGRYLGVPLLQWLGMTYDEKQAHTNGLKPYPAMRKWLCTERPE